MKTFTAIIRSIIHACPYSIAARKCMNVVRGHKKVTTKKLQKFQNGIKTGRNIALIGVFCPFLWYSILTQQSANLTLLHAIHSGIIVGLGLLVLFINYLALYIHKRR